MSTITLITGTPRSGKTLYAVEQLHKFILADDLRPIYCDIRGITSNVVLPAPDDWRDVPDGSVIFYDECQFKPIFNAKFRGQSDIILEMTMHGHRGIDIFFITQGTRYMNTDIFPLVNRHVHVHNSFRSKRGSKLYLWDTVQTNLSKSNLKDAVDVISWRYPEHLYDTYISSTVHNKESYLSGRIKKAIGILIALVCVAIYYVFQLFGSPSKNNIITNPESYKSQTVATAPATPTTPTTGDNPASITSTLSPAVDESVRVALVISGTDYCFAKNSRGALLPLSPSDCRLYADHPALLTSSSLQSAPTPVSALPPPAVPAPAAPNFSTPPIL